MMFAMFANAAGIARAAGGDVLAERCATTSAPEQVVGHRPARGLGGALAT